MGKESVVPIRDTERIKEALKDLRSSIMAMHKQVEDVRLKQTLLNQRKARGENMVNFSIGDYVLRSRVDEKHVDKLLVTWIGPYVVIGESEHSFRVKNLATAQEVDVHPSRLKFYAESSLEVTEELVEHVASQGIVMRVQEFKEHRWNERSQDYEILVKWHGLETIEDSWEPVKSLAKDVHQLVKEYVESVADTDLSKFWAALKPTGSPRA